VATNTTDQKPNPPGVRGLIGQLIEQVIEMGRLYATAARQEVEEGLNHLKIAIILFGVTATFLAVGVVVLVLLVVSALSAAIGIPLWVTALVVLLIVLLLAGLFGWLGYRRLMETSIIPEQTIEAAKEDLEWAQHLTKRG
jgi:uncharacterized membrane protein YqjE